MLGSRADLMCAAKLDPELAAELAEAERVTGHRFRTNLSIAEVVAEARRPSDTTTALVTAREGR